MTQRSITQRSTAQRSTAQRIAVVVPVHDEEELLPVCLQSLATAAADTRLPVDLVIVLDSCTDGSAFAAVDHTAFSSVRFVSVQARNVGAARRAGFAALTGRQDPQLWLATTDADSRVPPDWFTRQLAHRSRGADAVMGTVVVRDWTGCSDTVRQRYLGAYRAADGHRHVHGANLSFSAASYVAAGGFRSVRADEDVRLVADLAAAGQQLVWAGDLAVTTSARLTGRAPGGFADHLAGLADLAGSPEATGARTG